MSNESAGEDLLQYMGEGDGTRVGIESKVAEVEIELAGESKVNSAPTEVKSAGTEDSRILQREDYMGYLESCTHTLKTLVAMP